jgi:hypothetical protein
MAMNPLDAFAPSEESLRQTSRALRQWLGARLPKEDLQWLAAEAKACEEGPADRFYMTFSAVCRHAPKTPLALTGPEEVEAELLRPRWQPGHWTVENAARAYVLLHRSPLARDRWLAELTRLFENGDLEELVALYRALPLLPHPEALVDRCAEGVRSNMTDVFRAVAHRNPYPAEFLPDPAWNQMVLKALFLEEPLAPIVGLDDRANGALARMLCNFAHERWAAKRPVSPELWRCVGPHADEFAIKDLERALSEGDEATKAAAAAALRRCPWPEATWVLSRHGCSTEREP